MGQAAAGRPQDAQGRSRPWRCRRLGGRRTQRAPQSHEVHKTFEQVDCSSMETGAHTRSRLIPLQWVHKTKRDGTKKARLVMVGYAQRPGVDFDQMHCSTLKSASLRFLAATAAIHKVSACASTTSCPHSYRETSSPVSASFAVRRPGMRRSEKMVTTKYGEWSSHLRHAAGRPPLAALTIPMD